MPQRKERAGRYVRESDERLIAGTTTMESQTKLVNQYCEKERYICEPEHEWREAISSVEVPYMERKELLKMLAAAKQKEFDVLVISEIRALSRRQVEVLVIYDMLQKYEVRLETVKEKFGEDAMSKAILSLRAMFTEIEVEQAKARMMRGRADRIAIGQAPNPQAKAAFGYILVDTEKELSGEYQLNDTIVYVDEQGEAWTEWKIARFIFELFMQGNSLHGVCRVLNEKKLPTPKKRDFWRRGSVHFILTNPIYTGQVWANRYGKKKNAQGKPTTNVILPKEHWTRLPNAPAIITVEEFEAIQEQLKINKDESLRNYQGKREELGLLRCGFIFCGICGCRMRALPPSPATKKDGSTGFYVCSDPERDAQAHTRHTVQISLKKIDREVTERVIEILKDPNWCRERVKELREEQKKEEPVILKEDVQATVDGLKKSLRNLYKLAENATDDDTIADLAQTMNGLETQKRKAELLLSDFDVEDETAEELEKEIQRFEQWAEGVRPQLTDPTYEPTYQELRLAIRIIGIRVIVFPSGPEHPFRRRIDVTIPKIMKVLSQYCDKTNPYLCPDALIDTTRCTRKSHSTSGWRNGATKPPLAAST